MLLEEERNESRKVGIGTGASFRKNHIAHICPCHKKAAGFFRANKPRSWGSLALRNTPNPWKVQIFCLSLDLFFYFQWKRNRSASPLGLTRLYLVGSSSTVTLPYFITYNEAWEQSISDYFGWNPTLQAIKPDTHPTSFLLPDWMMQCPNFSPEILAP